MHVVQTWANEGLRPLEGLGIPLQSLVRGLVQEIESVGRADSAGVLHIPDQINLSLNAGDAEGLAGVWTSLQEGLLKRLEDSLRSAGFAVPRKLHLSVATDPSLEPGEVKVIVWHSGDPLGVETPRPPVARAAGSTLQGAFLVVGGSQIFNLDKDEVKVGRRMDNDLVLNHPRVSRSHAVISRESGRYTIRDLDSTAGSMVNGRRVEAAELAPGDVIRLADIELVYGERPGEPPSRAPAYAPPVPAASQPPTEALSDEPESGMPPSTQPPPTSPRPAD